MRRLAIMVVLTAALAGPLTAQRPLQLSLAGGLSTPQSDLKDVAELGWHALGAINVSSLLIPLGIRVDAAWNRFATSDDAPGVAAADLTVISLTGNLTYRWPMTNSTLSPYIIAGLGAYRTDCNANSGCESETDFGWNAGAGTKLYLLGFRSFLEVRFHATSRGAANVTFLPLTFGITF
jgi:opacity protein-like surface antigen